MRLIYHIVLGEAWESMGEGSVRPASLEGEGFIHCSYGDQVARVANQFYADQKDLVVLAIDADGLGPLVRDEPAETGERFPHVFGPIPRSAICCVRRLGRGPSGRWVFEERVVESSPPDQVTK
jgi:uncharacterized protein (DUF952 family)